MPTWAEVGKNASRQSCWIVIRSAVYDVSDFLDSHPGGSKVILKYAGRDATEAFEPLHPSNTLEKYLDTRQNLGPVTGTPIFGTATPQEKQLVTGSKRVKLNHIINLQDFEKAASKVLSPRSFAFFRTGSDDEHTLEWNRRCWKAITFRPRVLRPIDKVDISATILGTRFSAPFLICPAGGGKLAHPTGETLLTRSAGKNDILHWVCNNAGCTQKEMADARIPNQSLYWQIYAMHDLKVTEQEIKDAVASGYKGFALTVDAIRASKRERDVRATIEESLSSNDDNDEEDETFSPQPIVKRPIVWVNFDWVSAIKWLRNLTDLPILIKGIQSWQDAEICMQYGAHPWLSNHGGRQLEGSPSALDTLLEIRQHCPEVLTNCEVIVDGGIMRGTDVVKALALGAKAVGLGRAFLYALVFGEPGINKAISILKHEVETTLALLGVTSIEQLDPSYVDTSGYKYASAITRARL